MLDRAPSVVITSNRNELKVYQGNNVYLNDGDNFELRFFNPLPEKIGVEINFNGITKGDGYLVLNPGQDLILDRFLDEQRKMLFETYVINGDNKEAVEAIAKNGIITFNFYKEHGSYMPKDVNINYAFPPKPYKYNANKLSGKKNKGLSGHPGTSGTSGGAGISGTSAFGGSYTTNTYNTFKSPGVYTMESDMSYISTNSNSNSRIYPDDLLSRGIYTNSTSTDWSKYIAENLETSVDYSEYMAQSTVTSAVVNPLETGRIEMGAISNQQLRTVNAQFSSTPIHTVTYQLLPYSAMNRTIKEVREYCPHCGYRLRKETWNFCPKCGEDLK
jgi:hypothetical protein